MTDRTDRGPCEHAATRPGRGLRVRHCFLSCTTRHGAASGPKSEPTSITTETGRGGRRPPRGSWRRPGPPWLAPCWPRGRSRGVTACRDVRRSERRTSRPGRVPVGGGPDCGGRLAPSPVECSSCRAPSARTREPSSRRARAGRSPRSTRRGAAFVSSTTNGTGRARAPPAPGGDPCRPRSRRSRAIGAFSRVNRTLCGLRNGRRPQPPRRIRYSRGMPYNESRLRRLRRTFSLESERVYSSQVSREEQTLGSGHTSCSRLLRSGPRLCGGMLGTSTTESPSTVDARWPTTKWPASTGQR